MTGSNETGGLSPLQEVCAGGSGWCAACGAEHAFARGPAYEHAVLLMRELEEKERIDLEVPTAEADPRFATDYLFGAARGQMFGVMVCKDQGGNHRVLRAFSCQYNGEWEVEGWVGPLFDVTAFKALTCDVEKRIKELGAEMARRDGHGQAAEKLRRQRKELSRQLMKEIHALYLVTNFRGETRPLAEVFNGSGGIPTGTGDCCAPKLLHHAAQNNLTPLGIAEFYWGRENRSGTRQHGRFYSACKEKCAPILGFLLCGLEKG